MQYAHSKIAGFDWTSNPQDQYIGKSLQTYGEWSYGEIVLLGGLLAPDATAVEVGANIGAHTVPLARHLHAGRVIAFEPQRICFQLLCANLVNNGCINVAAYNMAVGDVTGTARIPDVNPATALNFGGIGVDQTSIDPGASVALGKTPLVRLDDMIGDGVKVDMIKCDAEGMEQRVVEGARALIERDKPVLYLEDDRPALSQGLYECVRDLGYEIWWHPVPLYRAGNLAGQAENIFPNVYSLSLLCCHASVPRKIAGLTKLDSFTDHPAQRNAAGGG